MNGSSPVGSWLLDAKLRPPVPPADRLERRWPGLPSPPPPLVAIEGGPGAGKTDALLGLVDDRAAAGATAVWLGLDEDDGDAAAFFQLMVAGMRRHIPDFGEVALTMLREGRLEARPLWRACLGDVAAYGVPGLAIALDDAHHALRTPDLLAALGDLADRLPPGMNVFAASRRPLPFTRALAAGRAARLDEAALRFTAAEQEAYLKARARGGEVPPAWRRRAAALEGWPLGLALLTAGGPGAAGPGERALDAYIADELLRDVPPARRDLMRRLALLPAASAEDAAAVLEAPDAAAHLAALEAEGLLQRLDGGLYRFPAYLRTFLRAEAGQALAPEALAALQRRVAARLVAGGEPAAALPHLVAVKAWEEALATCQAAFPALHLQGRHAEIARWLAAFPPELRTGEPVLGYWRAQAHARAGRVAEAATAYARAQAGFAARGMVPDEVAALVRLATLAAQTDDLPRFNKLAMQAVARAADARPADLADLHLARARLAERRGDASLAGECYASVLAVPLDDGPEAVATAAAHVAAHRQLADAALGAGEVDGALRHAMLARTLADARGLEPAALAARFVAGRALLARGEPGAAAAALGDLPPDWAERVDWAAGVLGHVVVGALAAAHEAWDDAEAALREAVARSEAAGWPEGRKLALEATAGLAMARREFARVAALVEAAGRPAAPEDWNAFDLALALPKARARHLAGRPAEAVAAVAEALPGLARQGLKLLLARAHMIEAAARLELGEADAAAAAWRVADDLRRDHGYDFLAAVDPALWRACAPLRDAAPAGAQAARAPAHAAARPSAATPAAAPAPRPAAAPPAGEPRLRLRCFGGFEVLVDGRALDRWPRRKAKLLLAALALRGGPISTFELSELVGGGDAASGHEILRVTATALRRALEPDLGPRGSSAFVRSAGEGYALVEEPGTNDLRAFERAIARGDARRAASPAEAAEAYEAALGLYRGELFDEPLLAGYFEAERAGFRRQALDAALWLAERRGEAGDDEGREAWLRRAAAIAPCDEEVYVKLMRHHRATGRRDRVRQAYWDCRKALKRHTGDAPSEEFEAAYRALA